MEPSLQLSGPRREDPAPLYCRRQARQEAQRRETEGLPRYSGRVRKGGHRRAEPPGCPQVPSQPTWCDERSATRRSALRPVAPKASLPES